MGLGAVGRVGDAGLLVAVLWPLVWGFWDWGMLVWALD